LKTFCLLFNNNDASLLSAEKQQKRKRLSDTNSAGGNPQNAAYDTSKNDFQGSVPNLLFIPEIRK